MDENNSEIELKEALAEALMDNNPAEQPQQEMPEQIQPESVPERSPEMPQQAMSQTPQQQIPDMNQMVTLMQQMMNENQMLRQQLTQQSAQAEQAINEQIFQPPAPPMLNFDELQYADDEARAAAQQKYAQEMAEYSQKQIMEQLKPLMQDYEQNKKMAEREKAKRAIVGMGKFPDFEQNSAEIERILGNVPALESANPAEQYILGYLINKGLHASNNPAQRNVDDIVNEAMGNPDVLKAIQMRLAAQTNKVNANIPAMATSSGVANIAPTIPEKPKSMDDIREELKREFGL